MPVVSKEQVSGSGLYFFKDQQRACTAECMAYVIPPDHPDYKNQQWAHCLELVNLHRVGKSALAVVNEVQALTKLLKGDAAERARANQPKPPVPQ